MCFSPIIILALECNIMFSAYKSSAADSLLAERGRIDSSHRMTDDVIKSVFMYPNFCLTLTTAPAKPMKHVQSSLVNEARSQE